MQIFLPLWNRPILEHTNAVTVQVLLWKKSKIDLKAFSAMGHSMFESSLVVVPAPTSVGIVDYSSFSSIVILCFPDLGFLYFSIIQLWTFIGYVLCSRHWLGIGHQEYKDMKLLEERSVNYYSAITATIAIRYRSSTELGIFVTPLLLKNSSSLQAHTESHVVVAANIVGCQQVVLASTISVFLLKFPKV